MDNRHDLRLTVSLMRRELKAKDKRIRELEESIAAPKSDLTAVAYERELAQQEREIDALFDMAIANSALQATLFEITHIAFVYPAKTQMLSGGGQSTSLAEQLKGYDETLTAQLTAVIGASRQSRYFDDMPLLKGLSRMVSNMVDAIQKCTKENNSAALYEMIVEHGTEVIRLAAAYRQEANQRHRQEERTARLIELIDANKPKGRTKWKVIAHNVYGTLKRNEPRQSNIDRDILLEFEQRMTQDMKMDGRLIEYLENTYNQAKRRGKRQEARKTGQSRTSRST